MAAVRNILFIMADQLRWDYLSYAGHKTLPKLNIDALAARGLDFNQAFAVPGSFKVDGFNGKRLTSLMRNGGAGFHDFLPRRYYLPDITLFMPVFHRC